MHVVFAGPSIPPKGQAVTVMCPRSPYMSGMDSHDIGKQFIDEYSHDIALDLVRLYIEYSYQAPADRCLLYASFLKKEYTTMASGADYIITSVLDYCEEATDTHSTPHENVFEYFGQRTDLMCDGIFEMYRMYHTDIFYPVTDMIALLKQNGLTVTPDALDIGLNYYKIYMTIMTDEYAYHEFDDEDDYPCAPFRLAVAQPPTFAHLRRDVNWR